MSSTRIFAIFLLLGLATLAVAQTTDDQTVLLQQLGRKGSAASSDADTTANPCDSADGASLGGCGAKLSDIQGSPRGSAVGPALSVNDMQSFGPGKGRGGEILHSVSEPITEFQSFVQSSTGEILPIYGASLFSVVPTTFAPVDQIPLTPDYTLGPGDEIQLTVWGQVNFSKAMVVDRTGDVFIPQAGRLNLAGVPFGNVRGVIQSALARVYRNFDLNVNMGHLRSVQVFIVGYARHPGAFTISSLSTLVNALFASGGPSSSGSLRQIQLRRSGQLITTFDLYDLLLRGDKSKDALLKSGDVIFIPAHGPQVALAGSVTSPAIYELPAGSDLQTLFEYAGGLSPIAAAGDAILERIGQDHPTLESIRVPLTEPGLKTPLRNGDIVRLLPVVPRFDRTVTIRGNVADPVRLPWHEGIRISDLIPERQALLTRDYWTEHNRLNEKEQFHTDIGQGSNSDRSLGALSASAHTAEIRRFESRNSAQPPAPQIKWNYAVIERTDRTSLATHLIPFNLGKIVIDHDASADVLLEPGDVIVIFSEADFVSPIAEQSTYVRLEGEVKNAGVYTVHPGESLRDLVARAGGLTSNAYLFGTQFTRESTKREQQKRLNAYIDQLEHDLDQSSASLASRAASAAQETSTRSSFDQQRQALERIRGLEASGRIVLDLAPDAAGAAALPTIALENGDRLVVPPTPATVSVVGTVYNPSAFLFNNSSAVGEYLRQAGGPTRFADKSNMFILRADGSVFSAANHNNMFRGHFESLRMFPGDSLMVPSNVIKVSRMRTLLDWSQVFSGFGLAAAAVNVLK